MNKQKFKQIVEEGIARRRNFMVVKIREVKAVAPKIVIVQDVDVKLTVGEYLKATNDDMVFTKTGNKIEDVLFTSNLNDLSWFAY